MQAVRQAAENAKAAAKQLALLDTTTKNRCLLELADRILLARDDILQANEEDVAAAERAGLSSAKLKRLRLTLSHLEQMSEGVRQVAALEDPVARCTRDEALASGLRVTKVRCPIGVILMIYEARPNVTIDAFALCFKSGNACILKGGREAQLTNAALARQIHQVLARHGVATESLVAWNSSDRDAMMELLKFDDCIDLVIPRGGTDLIRFVHENSRIPTVQHFHGVCHIFVDATADVDKAIEICLTAKTSAPAACNAVEAVLVHRDIAARFVPALVARYRAAGVEVRGDAHVRDLAPEVHVAAADDWGREFLDLIVAMKVVEDLPEAIDHIQRYGSNHTEAIVSEDQDNQRRFTQEVQSSCALVNASTRFNDGFQLGLGAEIGISTSKVHAYGPMGLEELTAERFVVYGDGHAR